MDTVHQEPSARDLLKVKNVPFLTQLEWDDEEYGIIQYLIRVYQIRQDHLLLLRLVSRARRDDNFIKGARLQEEANLLQSRTRYNVRVQEAKLSPLVNRLLGEELRAVCLALVDDFSRYHFLRRIAWFAKAFSQKIPRNETQDQWDRFVSDPQVQEQRRKEQAARLAWRKKENPEYVAAVHAYNERIRRAKIKATATDQVLALQREAARLRKQKSRAKKSVTYETLI